MTTTLTFTMEELRKLRIAVETEIDRREEKGYNKTTEQQEKIKQYIDLYNKINNEIHTMRSKEA